MFLNYSLVGYPCLQCISTVFHYVTGFNEGWIFFDDANRKNANAYWGTLPDGEYGRDTKIFYCCCSDGFAANAFIFPRTLLLQPRTQACSRYPSGQRRLGTERDSLGEFSRQAWQVTSHPKSPRTTGNETAPFVLLQRGLQCQYVHGMNVRYEFFKWDLADKNTRYQSSGSILRVKLTDPPFVFPNNGERKRLETSLLLLLQKIMWRFVTY